MSNTTDDELRKQLFDIMGDVYVKCRQNHSLTGVADVYSRKVLALIHRTQLESHQDERQRISDEIDAIVVRHSSNRDLSPIAELRDYLKQAALEKQA